MLIISCNANSSDSYTKCPCVIIQSKTTLNGYEYCVQGTHYVYSKDPISFIIYSEEQYNIGDTLKFIKQLKK